MASLWLMGLAFTAPFLVPVHRYPMPSFYGEWLALALGLMALVPLVRRDGWENLRVPVASFWLIGLVAVAWLQYALGRMPYAGQALAPAIYLLWAALLMTVAYRLRQVLGLDAMVTTFAWFLLAGGLLSAATGILQHYQLDPWFGGWVTAKRWSRVAGNIAQANHYAAYSVLALVSLLYLCSRGRFGHRWLAVLAAAFVLFAAALSGSRSLWLFLAAPLAVSAVLWLRGRRPEHARLLAGSVALLPALIAASWLVSLPWLAPPAGAVETAMDRLFTTVDGLERRIGLWQEAWWMFQQAPVLGIGFGQFAAQHFEYQVLFGRQLEAGLTNHAHNILFQLLAETGLAGTLLVAGLVAGWLAGLRALRADAGLWWLLAVMGVLAVHSGLDFPLWYTYFLGIAAVVLGAGAAGTRALNLARLGPVIAITLLVAGLAHATLVLRDFRRFELLVFKPYATPAEIPPAERFREIVPAVHQEPLLAPYVEVLLGMIATADGPDLGEKLALLDRAARFAPAPYLVYRKGLLLAAAGDREAAIAQIRRALRVYPADAGRALPELTALAAARPAVFGPLLEWIGKERTSETTP